MTPPDGHGNEGLVGKGVARPNVKRLIHGRGRYTDDIAVPHMLHIAFVRSPYGHARINSVDTSMATNASGVVRIITGAQVAEICEPMLAIAAHRPGHKSAPQHAMAAAPTPAANERAVVIVMDAKEMRNR